MSEQTIAPPVPSSILAPRSQRITRTAGGKHLPARALAPIPANCKAISPTQAVLEESDGRLVAEASDAELHEAMRAKAGDLISLALRTNYPGASLASVLEHLPRQFEQSVELLYGRRRPVPVDQAAD